ncbi:MAG TPA: hypothetical protein VFX18_06100 [Candidatus Nitrosocosmicus sp.]|nr:hypothetical protein [Candidatus Nitrosocosmicus sp.]
MTTDLMVRLDENIQSMLEELIVLYSEEVGVDVTKKGVVQKAIAHLYMQEKAERHRKALVQEDVRNEGM